MLVGFKNSSGGFYQAEIANENDTQNWAIGMTRLTEQERQSEIQITFFIPQTVTMRQARLALLEAGLLAAVNSTIQEMQGQSGEAARIEWEFSSEVYRSRPLVQSLAPVLGMTDSQLDQLFVAASQL